MGWVITKLKMPRGKLRGESKTISCWEARFPMVSRGSLVPRSEKSSRFCTHTLKDKAGSSTSPWTLKHPASQERQLA